MTRDQILTLAILAGMIVLFLSNRVRYDMVGLLGLMTAVFAGIVPADHAFSGFANPVLPLIAAALVVSAAIGQSGAVEILLRWLNPMLRSKELQVGVLVACVALLSAFMKNVGALAIFLPAAMQVARRNERSPSEFLMPLAFASLLGGSITLIGTSPNMLISSVRQDLVGAPFGMFDFAPVGAGIAVVGVLFLAVGWRLIPRRRRSRGAEAVFSVEDYTSELRVGKSSAYVGRTVGDVEELSGGAVSVTAVIRDDSRQYVPGASWPSTPRMFWSSRPSRRRSSSLPGTAIWKWSAARSRRRARHRRWARKPSPRARPPMRCRAPSSRWSRPLSPPVPR